MSRLDGWMRGRHAASGSPAGAHAPPTSLTAREGPVGASCQVRGGELRGQTLVLAEAAAPGFPRRFQD